MSVSVDAAGEETSASEEPEKEGSFLEALVSGKPRVLLRYSGQYRNSSLHLLQDSSNPIPEV